MQMTLVAVIVELNSAESGSDGSSDGSDENDQHVCISTFDIN